jgi:hypothetical protein
MRAYFTFIGNSGEPVQVNINKVPFVIGREENCNLCIVENSVFKRHAQIQLTGERYSIQDMGSYEGTYVNGERINETVLKTGDMIRIGTRKMQFTLDMTAIGPVSGAIKSGVTAAPHETNQSSGQVVQLIGRNWDNYKFYILGGLAGIVLILFLLDRVLFPVRPIEFNLPPGITLQEGTTSRLAIGPVSSLRIEDASIAHVQTVDNTLIIEGLNAGQTKVQLLQAGEIYKTLNIDVRATVVDTEYPELKQFFNLPDLERIQKAQLFIKEGNNLFEEKDRAISNLSTSLQAYRKAVFLLKNLNPAPSVLIEAQQKRDEAEQALTKRWDQHFFQLKRAFEINDYIKAREETNYLLNLIPDAKDPRHEQAVFYWDKLKNY